MSDLRDPGLRTRRQSRARYRCAVCKRFVVATEYGVCPRCGMGPPSLPESLLREPQVDADAWREARGQARQLGLGSASWIRVVALVIAVIGATALLVVC